MTAIRRIHRRGIELVPAEGEMWKLELIDGEELDWARLKLVCGEHPVLVEEDYGHGRHWMTLAGGLSFGLETTSLQQRFLVEGATKHFRVWEDVVYLLNALDYHRGNLAKAYARIRADHLRRMRIPGFESDDDAITIQGGTEDVWYELDAVLSVAQRVLESSRCVLWSAYGRGPRGRPKNLKITLNDCPTLPSDLKAMFEDHLNRYGAKLNAYRDFLAHYSSLTRDFASVEVDRHHGPWLVSALLPDDVGKRAERAEATGPLKFTYNDKRDALDYACVITDEVLALMKTTARTIAPHPSFDAR